MAAGDEELNRSYSKPRGGCRLILNVPSWDGELECFNCNSPDLYLKEKPTFLLSFDFIVFNFSSCHLIQINIKRVFGNFIKRAFGELNNVF